MKITPVKKGRIPKYPDQYAVDLNTLLLANKPARWNATPMTGVVLSTVLMLGLAGCGQVAETGEDGITGSITPTETPNGTPSATTLSARAQTPLFEHGEGIGVYGCVSVAAPVFLSEDDAYAIICDEFSKMDLTVERDGGRMKGIQIPKTYLNYNNEDKERHKKTQTGSMDFDFRIEGKNVVMEYVSNKDMELWAGEQGYNSTVSQYGYKEAAKTLNDSLNESELESTHAVFYDPAETESYDSEKNYEEMEAIARERSGEALRAQVRDFIEWLAAQGII